MELGSWIVCIAESASQQSVILRNPVITSVARRTPSARFAEHLPQMGRASNLEEGGQEIISDLRRAKVRGQSVGRFRAKYRHLISMFFSKNLISKRSFICLNG